MPKTLIAALYHFASLPDYRELRDPITAKCREHRVVGTLLLAEEGLNGTIAGPENGLRALLTYLRSDPRLAALAHKESWADETPFVRLKVRLKKEIVTLGVPGTDPTKVVGTYVQPVDWNALISQPDVVLIDTRNTYETVMGTFEGAEDPRLDSFRDFPDWVEHAKHLTPDTRVAMYCTGGIRCEKASSFLLDQGIKEVFHLQGGILKYLEEIPQEESLWKGECYVFDRRVSLDHDLNPGRFELCMACGFPMEEAHKSSAQYIEGVACPDCFDTTSEARKAGFAERQRQIRLARTRHTEHLGVPHRAKERRDR